MLTSLTCNSSNIVIKNNNSNSKLVLYLLYHARHHRQTPSWPISFRHAIIQVAENILLLTSSKLHPIPDEHGSELHCNLCPLVVSKPSCASQSTINSRNTTCQSSCIIFCYCPCLAPFGPITLGIGANPFTVVQGQFKRTFDTTQFLQEIFTPYQYAIRILEMAEHDT